MALSLELVPLQYSAILSKVVMPNTIASAKIGDDAVSAVKQRVLGWCRSHKGASVAEKREAAKLIMEGFMQAYDDKAAEFAPQWYDHPHSRAARGSSRPARLNPHPRLAHVYHERFLFWRFAMPASCNAARHSKLTAEGIASRVALYDSYGIMEMNSAQNTKRTRFEHLCPPQVRTIKMAPRVGFEPTTLRLTAGCSAVELPRNLPISCALSERAR